MKTKFLFPIIVAAFFVCYGSMAQGTFSIGPRIGANFANVTGDFDTSSKTGLLLGVTSTYSFNEYSGIMADVLYTQHGYEIVDEEIDFNYIQIPIHYALFFGDLGDNFRPKAYAGFSPGFLLSGETTDGTDISDDLKGFVFSFSGGIGFNLKLADRVWLNVDGRTLLGLGDIREDDLQTGEQFSFKDFSISAGVAFGLSKL